MGIVDHVIRKALYDESARLQEAKKQFQQAMDTIATVFKNIIAHENMENEDYTVTKDEFHRGLEDITVQRLLNNIDIEIHDAEELFEMMDVNKNGHISLDEFVDGCLRMKGQATSKNLMMVQVDLQRQMRQQGEHLTRLCERQDNRLQRLEAAVEHLTRLVEPAVAVLKSVQDQDITKFAL